MEYPIDAPGVRHIIDYLGHHPAKPKQEIGRAMANLGFRVPKIFDNYAAAKSSGERFFARSEHPGELFYSGLAESYYSRSKWLTEAEVDAIVAGIENPERTYNTLIQLGRAAGKGFKQVQKWHQLLTGDMSTEYRDKVARLHSLSYWQAVEGPNYYMCGDSGRSNRLYIGRCDTDEGQFFVVDDGDVVPDVSFWGGQPTPPVERLIEYYQQVRTAAPFDPNVLPTVECADDGSSEFAFLQANPTRPVQGADFEAPTDQSNILFVRGTTPNEGVEFDILAFRARQDVDYKKGPFSYSVHESAGQFEYSLPRGEVHFIANGSDTPESFLRRIGKQAAHHRGRSEIFKPPVTIGLTYDAWVQLHDIPLGADRRRAWLRSDGERATVQYWDETEQQFVEL